MSTILNALKRLEDRTRSRDDKSIPGTMRGRGRAAGQRWRMPVAVVVVGLAIVGAALGAYWGYGKWGSRVPDQKDAPSASKPAGSALSAPNGSTPAASEEKNASADNRQLLPSRGAAGPSNAAVDANRKAGLSTRKPKSSPASDAQKSTGRDASRRRPKDVTPSQRTAAVESTANAAAVGSAREGNASSRATARPATILPPKPAREVSPPSSLPARDPYDNAELMIKGELNLQAISWSDLASARITIINSSILREGQSVDGYAVVEIRPEHVILSKAEKYWKLGYDN